MLIQLTPENLQKKQYTANSVKPTKKAINQQAGIVPELVFKLGR